MNEQVKEFAQKISKFLFLNCLEFKEHDGKMFKKIISELVPSDTSD